MRSIGPTPFDHMPKLQGDCPKCGQMVKIDPDRRVGLWPIFKGGDLRFTLRPVHRHCFTGPEEK